MEEGLRAAVAAPCCALAVCGNAEEERAAAAASWCALVERGLGDVVEEVCRLRAVTFEELYSRSRTKNVSFARAELWWRLRSHRDTNFSLKEIGTFFGRDHSTIHSGIQAHERRLRVKRLPQAQAA